METQQKLQYHSRGKLLLTGEYAVLDGALSLAMPTCKGQVMNVLEDSPTFVWESYDHREKIWFSMQSSDLLAEITAPKVEGLPAEEASTRLTLCKLLRTLLEINPLMASRLAHSKITTHLEFDRAWGLGSSSTLINNLAQWADVDPYTLLFKGFGGSGYDIACARASTALLYRLSDGKPQAYPVRFLFPYSDHIYFVYRNQKQSSKEGIALYRKVSKSKTKLATTLSHLTERLVLSQTIADFCDIIDTHERTLAAYLGLPTVKEQLFADYRGSVKSLGAWGGDFLLAISACEDTPAYFAAKGYQTCVPYSEMIYNNKG